MWSMSLILRTGTTGCQNFKDFFRFPKDFQDFGRISIAVGIDFLWFPLDFIDFNGFPMISNDFYMTGDRGSGTPQI